MSEKDYPTITITVKLETEEEKRKIYSSVLNLGWTLDGAPWDVCKTETLDNPVFRAFMFVWKKDCPPIYPEDIKYTKK